MKKILLLFFVVLCCSNAFAQKRYIELTNDQDYYYLYGEVPPGLVVFDMEYLEEKGLVNGVYTVKYRYGRINKTITTFVGVINALEQYGFQLEYYNTVYVNGSSDNYMKYSAIMFCSPYSPSSVQQIPSDIDHDGDVREVARYNLQGMPIGKNEKGIQIIVYSNYTTRTIFVE